MMLNALYEEKKEQQDKFGDHDISFLDGLTYLNLVKRSNLGYLAPNVTDDDVKIYFKDLEKLGFIKKHDVLDLLTGEKPLNKITIYVITDLGTYAFWPLKLKKERKNEKRALEINLLKSQEKTNKSVQSTNKIQNLSIYITGLAIIIGVVSQITQCNISNKSLKQNTKLILIDQEKQKIDSLKEIFLNARIDSINISINSMNKKNVK